MGSRLPSDPDPLSAARRAIDRRRRQERRRRRRSRRLRSRLAGAAVYVLALNVAAWLSLETPSELVSFGHMLDADKVQHLLAFFLAAVVAIPAVGRWVSAGILAILLMNAGLVIEMVQAFDPGRTADIVDFAADQAGVGLGWLAAMPLRRWFGRHRELPVREA